MARDGGTEPAHVEYGRMLPFVHLFRAFRIAIDFRLVLLGALAVATLAVGNWLFADLPFGASTAAAGARPWETQPGNHFPSRFLADPAAVPVEFARDWQLVFFPLRTIADPAASLFRPRKTWSEAAAAWTRLLWALVVWAFFGTVICRMAAVQFARDLRIGMVGAMKFSGRKFLSSLSAPLLPASGIFLLWLLCLMGGLFGRIPYVGEPIVAALLIVPLALGLLMALILLLLGAGWPLMYATIGTEGSDAFDGFSRAYSYAFSRVWHYLWLTLVAATYGAAVLFFVATVASLLVYLAGWGLASGMGFETAGELLQRSPEVFRGATARLAWVGEGWGGAGASLAGFWLHAVAALLLGFIVSYFWTAATIIYFVLRRSDDATALDEVDLPEDEERDDLLPLVGIAASDQPPIERPPKPPAEPGEEQPVATEADSGGPHELGKD